MKLKALTYILLFASSVAAAEDCVKSKNLPKHYKVECVQANGLAVFEDTKKDSMYKQGLMNAQGKIIAPAQYRAIKNDGKPYIQLSKQLMIENDVTEGDVLIDMQGKEIIPLESNPSLAKQYMSITEERVIVSREYKNLAMQVALFDTTGKQLTPFKYARIDDFRDGLAYFITPPTYKYGRMMNDGRAGYLNLQGKEVIPAIYKQARRFHSGIAIVVDERKDSYLIDTKGNKLWKVPYEYRLLFNQFGHVIIYNKQSEGALLDKTGKIVIPFGKLDNFYFHPKFPLLVIYSDADTIGLADLQGNILLKPARRKLYGKDNNRVAFIEGDIMAYYDIQGRLLKTEPTKYAKECAHVKLGMPYKIKPSYHVVEWNSQTNYVAVFDDKGNHTFVSCSDIGTPQKATPKRKR